MASRRSLANNAAQLALPLWRPRTPDRNAGLGGRSFYFFDFDDNVMALGTPIFVYHKDTRAQIALGTAEFAAASPLLGRPGPWREFEVDRNDAVGSFRRFRDHTDALGEQPFVEDIDQALTRPDYEWQGPSWELFWHAVYNGRSLAIITARGHHPTTMARGISRLVKAGHLSDEPNFLGIFPVSHPGVRADLGDASGTRPIPELKVFAIERCVALAFERFGQNPHHRFGMSDDAPENLELVLQAMHRLKARYPDNAFFVIDSSVWPLCKIEVKADGDDRSEVADLGQLELFG
jgi:hypothetical protein